jgi:SET domain-containing protein
MTKIIIDNDDAPFAYVKDSLVEGYGLFAARDLAKDALVVDYRLFPRDWCKVRYLDISEEQKLKNWYVMLDDEDCITSGKYSKFNYINHSREPNCDWVLSIHKIITNREIKKDEELFIDYRLQPRPSGVSFPEWI